MVMQWQKEFGSGYAVPGWFTKNMEDESWHNNTSPSFSLGADLAHDPVHPEDQNPWILVWVEHPDPDQREDPRWPRFNIQVVRGEEGAELHESYEQIMTEDLQTAVQAIQQRARAIGLEEPPGLTDKSADIAAALAAINKDRASSGLRPLDPVAAGWSDDDILLEAKRIRSPNPLKKRLLNA